MENVKLPVLMNETAAATYLGVSLKKLQRDRLVERRLPYVKLGRQVRYRAIDLLAYVEASMVPAAPVAGGE